MKSLPNKNRKGILFGSGLIFSLFVTIGITLSINTNGQQVQVIDQNDKDQLIRKIQKSTERSLKVLESNDSPLRIIEAKVKEVPSSDFTKLTGKTTDLTDVSTVPEVNLLNTSGKTITGFIFGIREPNLKATQTLSQQKISIAPGENYTIKREHFVPQKKTTISDSKGTRQEKVQPKMDLEKYWIDFGKRSDLFVTVGVVYFDDDTQWVIKEEGELK